MNAGLFVVSLYTKKMGHTGTLIYLERLFV